MLSGTNAPAHDADYQPSKTDIDVTAFSTVPKGGIGCKLPTPQPFTEDASRYAARLSLDKRCAFNCGEANSILGHAFRRSHCDSNGGGLALDGPID